MESVDPNCQRSPRDTRDYVGGVTVTRPGPTGPDRDRLFLTSIRNDTDDKKPLRPVGASGWLGSVLSRPHGPIPPPGATPPPPRPPPLARPTSPQPPDRPPRRRRRPPLGDGSRPSSPPARP